MTATCDMHMAWIPDFQLVRGTCTAPPHLLPCGPVYPDTGCSLDYEAV